MSLEDSLDVCPHSKDGATQDVVNRVPQSNLTRAHVTTLALPEVCIGRLIVSSKEHNAQCHACTHIDAKHTQTVTMNVLLYY